MELERLKVSYYALSDETRLRILKVLSEEKELCVCQIQSIFGISQPNLSFHLRILREANMVRTKKRGKWVYYSLNMNNPILKANKKLIAELEEIKTDMVSCEL